MKFGRLIKFGFILWPIFLITVVKSDSSDDECAVWEEETATVASVADKPANLSSPLNKIPRKKRKKSLILVFDATNSMHRDLNQLRDAAKEIVETFSVQEENPIGNYILSVFRDPHVEPVLKTTDPTRIVDQLNKTDLKGNKDCPELALTGLKQAIEVALPNSNAFLFSDASAKDHELYYNVKKIIQQKQITVSFLLTGFCNESKNAEGYKVYENLAKSSGGLVFDMKRDNITSFMGKLRKTLDLKFETLKSFDYDSAGKSSEMVKVDDTFSKLNVIVSGNNSKLSIKDENNVEITTSDDFSLENVIFRTVNVGNSSSYTIEASADSAYSVRVGGISELKFQFGFSTNLPTEEAETSSQPLKNFKNILSIFVSNHDLVKCLTNATIIPATNDDTFEDIALHFEQKVGNIYSSKPIDLPRKMFKIKVFGYDRKGNVIERLISTGIESVTGVEPEIDIEYSDLAVKQHGSLSLNCKVFSLTPTTTTWLFDSKILKVKNSNQSTHNILEIHNFDVSHVGKYVCKSENSLGKDSKDISITMIKAPIVKVVPENLKIKAGETGSLKCSVTEAHGSFKINWKDAFDNLSEKNSETYKFTASPQHHNEIITCEVTNKDFVVDAQSLIIVEYPPEFYTGTNGSTIKKNIEHGAKSGLNCNTHENEKGKVKWFHSIDKTSSKVQLKIDSKNFDITNMRESMTGHYQCIVENSLGSVTRYFDVRRTSKEPPRIKGQKIVVFKSGQALKLECSCENCLPVKSKWKYNGKNPNHKIIEMDNEDSNNFTTTLLIENASPGDVKMYECELTNDKSSRKFKIQTKIDGEKPRDIEITLEGKTAMVVKDVVELTELEDYTLKCNANADPVPVITWFKKGLKTNKADIVFEVENIHKHPGNYKCVASNSFGSASKEIEVKVEIPAALYGESDDVSVTVARNGSYRLTCEIGGVPKPEYTWMYEGLPLVDAKFWNNRQNIDIEGMNNTEGEFTCTGKNSKGEASMTFYVDIQDIPPIKDAKDEKVRKREGESLILKCFVDGILKPDVYWMKTGNDEIIHEGNYFFIQKVKISDSGVYWCYVENIEGRAHKKFNVSVRS